METNPELTIPRRTLLLAVGASGALVACGSSDEPDAPPTTAESPGSAGGGGDVVAAAAEVPVGGGVVNTDLHIVVTQPQQGQYEGFSSICTHRRCDVSFVRDNVISCGCHGSQYSAETGEVLRGPALQPLGKVEVAVQGDNIVRA